MKQIVITGATGFAGSHVLEAFQNEPSPEISVTAACRNEAKLPKSYRGKRIIGDLLDQNHIQQLTTHADVICHTAAWAELNGRNTDSKKYFYRPTKELIDSATKNGVKRFIFLSSIISNPIEQKRIHTQKPLDRLWPHYDSIMKIEDYLKSLKNGTMEVVILRVGFFVGKNYSLGILPILLPRLNTHLVPWIKRGKTTLPLIDGRDIANAFHLSATLPLEDKINVIDIVGKETPSVKEVFQYLHEKHKYPLPLFSVGFRFAYLFARLMQLIHYAIPNDPLIVPSIVLLLEETHASNERAEKLLGFTPQIHWKESVDLQLEEMKNNSHGKMKMNKQKR